MPIPDWRIRPTIINFLPKTIKYALFIDEYGDHSFRHVDFCIRKGITPNPDNRYLGLCGTIFQMDNHQNTLGQIVDLKNTYWPPDGKHTNAIKNSTERCKVCFHSTEIKSSKGPFSKSIIDQGNLMNDIGTIISNSHFSLITCVVDKYAYAKRYTDNRKPPYSVAAEFMLERFACEINRFHEKAVVVLESRGKKEDAAVLSYLKEILEYGNYYYSKTVFQNILGVYFNPKRSCDNQKSYVGLEVADLCCSTLVRYAIDSTSQQDSRAFKCLKEKIRGYPNNISGRGIKIIP